MESPLTVALPWQMADPRAEAGRELRGDAIEKPIVRAVDRPQGARIRRRVILATGLIVSLFAGCVSWAYTVMTGAALWTLQADPSAAWQYALGMNLIYWNTWAILTPAILSFSERFLLARDTWRRSLPWHIVGGLLFVAAHVLMAATGRTWLQRLVGMEPSWWPNVSEAYLRTLDWELTFYWAAVALAHAMVFYRAAKDAAAVPPFTSIDDSLPSARVRRFWVRTDGGFALVSLDEIDWIEAAGNYACLHAGSETHVIRDSLKRLEGRLARAGFLRINRPTIVNLDRVKAIEAGTGGRESNVVLKDGTRLATTRQAEHRLRAALDVCDDSDE